MPDVHGNLEHTSSKEATNAPLHEAFRSPHLASCRVKAFALLRTDGVLLDVEAEGEQGWECICQVQEHGGRDDTDEAEVVRDSGCDDESDDPSRRDQGHVDEFAASSCERRCLEDID